MNIQNYLKKLKKRKTRKMKKINLNLKVVIFSIIALGFLVLTFTVNWIFIIGAVVLMILNQKELIKRDKNI